MAKRQDGRRGGGQISVPRKGEAWARDQSQREIKISTSLELYGDASDVIIEERTRI